jgi:hypothetical protein
MLAPGRHRTDEAVRPTGAAGIVHTSVYLPRPHYDGLVGRDWHSSFR